MAFVGVSEAQAKREDKNARILERAQEKLEAEPPLIIPDERKPWRASDIKNACARQVYYSRHHPHEGDESAGVAAVYGTTVHELFQYGANTEEDVFATTFENTLHSYGMRNIHDPRINWHSSAKPFSLAGFRDANPELKVWVLYQRYLHLDRVNYNWFWETFPFGVYRHPETGKLGNEVRLKAEIDGEEIITTADLMLTDLYTAEILPVDWKTGRASEPTQLATYAMAAEKFYGLEPKSIRRGMFVMTGTGECVAPRGKIPEKWIADPENCVAEEDLVYWRSVVSERLHRLKNREKFGIWTPKLNGLCYSACSYRNICPVGQAVQEIKGEDEA